MRRDEMALTNGWATHELPAGRSRIDSVPDDWPYRSASHMITAAGSRWHVQRAGAGSPVLLLHGTAASTHTWRDVMPLLVEHFDVLAVDLPGHGFSERLPNESMTLPAVAAGISALLATLGFAPRCVVGHSAGAAIALRMALDESVHPECVVGINAALLPFGGGLQRLFSPMAKFFANTRLLPKMVAKRAHDVNAVRRVLDGTGSRLDAAGVTFYQRLLQSESRVASVLAMMASWDLQPLLGDLPGLRARLHLVTGGRDQAVRPSEADKIAALVKGTTVYRLEDCGHLAHEEQAAVVAKLILDVCQPLRREEHAES